MMTGSCNIQGVVVEEEEEEEEELFFDSREDLSSLSDSCPSSPRKNGSCSEGNFVNWVFDDPRYQVWVKSPKSVRERRAKFMTWMGLDVVCSPKIESVDTDGELAVDIGRIMSDDGAVLRSCDSDNGSSTSSCSNEGPSTSEDGRPEDSFEYRIKNLDDGSVFVMDQIAQDGTLRSLREVGSNRMVTLDEFHRSFGPSSLVQQLMRRQDVVPSNSDKLVTQKRIGWLRRVGAAACIVDRQGEEIGLSTYDTARNGSGRARRVRVRPHRKRSKEFSAVYMGQDIKAHDGAIWTMRFSPDGEYLASGGEDGVVCVWRVMECERRGEEDMPEDDPSCIYFRVNHNSELAPLYVDKEKKVKFRNIRKTSDSACVVIPSDTFRISEKPVHEFHGHDGDILDLSWSKNKYLLSSSTDRTVRLWRVGCDCCLKIFTHNNYVTSIQFNPMDENFFVSGSIDGKVRIWEIPGCKVVDWTDIRDIVTAVCYRLDGKGVVVGSMMGDCRFYDASDNHLQLEDQISLQGKKKSQCKRITGFQNCPSDHRKLMVTSADSLVRILDGVDVVSKYKGLRNAGSQISASFTSDGRHIVSASEDSNVYVWSHADSDHPHTSNHVKTTRSCERFFSTNASVAIPWQGSASKSATSNEDLSLHQEDESTLYLSAAGSFTLSQEFFSEFLPKGSATWPEEKLPSSLAANSGLCKSHYKFLKTSCRNSSHAWGQVIVTAGWDGRIRSFQNYGLPVNL